MWNTRVGEKFDNSLMWPKWQVALWLKDELRQVLEGKAVTALGYRFMGIWCINGKLDHFPLAVIQEDIESA